MSPVPHKLKDEIRRAVNKEYHNLSLLRRKHITNAIIYNRLGYGRKKSSSVGMTFRTEKELNDYMHGRKRK